MSTANSAMIPIDQALQILRGKIHTLPEETVTLESALGKVLAEDCVADHDLPPFPRATMDGYALRASDTLAVPAALRILGEVAAGQVYPGEVSAGCAVRIMTGAPLPIGADAVQRVEATDSDGNSVIVNEAVTAGKFVTPRGEEARRGDLILKRGRRLFAGELGVLATFGYARVRIARVPRVAVLSTGSELVSIDQRPGPGQIRNSNAASIAASTERLGCIASNLGTAADNEALLTSALSKAFEAHDVVITSGGVSMGAYDLVKVALKQLNVETYFDRVALKPGKPVVFGSRGSKLFFGLPGNPVSAMVTFNLFVRPALLSLMGCDEHSLSEARATLTARAKPSPERTSYLPGRIRFAGARLEAEPLKWAGSSDLVGYAQADCLIVLPPGNQRAEAGEEVRVVLLEK